MPEGIKLDIPSHLVENTHRPVRLESDEYDDSIEKNSIKLQERTLSWHIIGS